METGDVLRTIELFAALTDAELETLAGYADERRVDRNDLFFSQGEDARELFVVLSGRVAITREFIDGRESVLALLDAGEPFGEMSFFDGKPRSADARATEPTTVLSLPYEPVRSVYEGRPELLWKVCAVLSERLRITDDALSDAMFLDVTGRTAKRVLELSEGREEFQLPITQEELAGMVGASRERVNKAIAQFARLGWLEQRDRRYVILNREALSIRSR